MVGTPEMLFNQAKCQGLSHKETNTPCQDSVAHKKAQLKGATVYAIALSDGCSSSSLSHVGSQITVDAIVDYLCAHFTDLLLVRDRSEASRQIIETVIDAQIAKIKAEPELFEEEKERKGDFPAFAARYGKYFPDEEELLIHYYLHMMNATLLFAATYLGETIYGQVGDGYILRLTHEGDFEIASMEEKDDNLGHNFTVYPQTLYFNRRRANSLVPYVQGLTLERKKHDVDAWVLISDGSENTFIEKRGPIQKIRPYIWNVAVLCTKEETPEDAGKILQGFFTEKVSPSTRLHGGDDISIVLMTTKDADVKRFVEINLDERPAEGEASTEAASRRPKGKATVLSSEQSESLKREILSLVVADDSFDYLEAKVSLRSDEELNLTDRVYLTLLNDLMVEDWITCDNPEDYTMAKYSASPKLRSLIAETKKLFLAHERLTADEVLALLGPSFPGLTKNVMLSVLEPHQIMEEWDAIGNETYVSSNEPEEDDLEDEDFEEEEAPAPDYDKDLLLRFLIQFRNVDEISTYQCLSRFDSAIKEEGEHYAKRPEPSEVNAKMKELVAEGKAVEKGGSGERLLFALSPDCRASVDAIMDLAKNLGNKGFNLQRALKKLDDNAIPHGGDEDVERLLDLLVREKKLDATEDEEGIIHYAKHR